ncbi:MAG: hypothetical protein GWP08_07690 [Nitrospiraceae bacterium]|nr:hypothetical protein [Nitrospiraceae bacterium]
MGKNTQQPQYHPASLTRDEVRPLLRDLHVQRDDGVTMDELVDLLDAMVSPGEDLAWLAAYDLDPRVSGGALTLLFHALREEILSEDEEANLRASAGPVLLKALESPRVPDSRKYSLGPVYGYCEDSVPIERYRSFFADFEGTTRQMLDEAIDTLSADPQSVERVLTGMESLVDEDTPPGSRFVAAAELAAHMVNEKPSAAAALLSANLMVGLEEKVEAGLRDKGFRLLEDARCPEAVWFLNEMSRWPSTGALGERAKRLATRMRMEGIEESYSLGPAYSYGIVTGPDGQGSRQLALFFDTPDGHVDAVVPLFNDAIGVKDVVCVYEEGDYVASQLRDRMHELPMSPCDLNRAREFLADAWACHEEQGTPFPAHLFIYRPYFGAEPIVPKRRTPDLSSYGLDSQACMPELVSGSERLADMPGYGMFTFSSDAAYAYVNEHLPRRGTCLSKPKFEGFLRAVSSEEKGVLLDRLAATLEVEAWAGRADDEMNALAARTWLGVSQNAVSFEKVPYVRALAQNGIEMIINNLRLGFRTQEEANEAAMAMEMECDDHR